MNLSLKGKNAVVCGSTGGIGQASALELASLGANIVLVARNEEKLKTTLASLPKVEGQNHQYLIVDFSNQEELKQTLTEWADQNEAHILINNTGGPPGGPITKSSPDEFLSAFNNHLICNHIITQVLSPGMIKSGYGRIVNIISTSVKIPLKGLGVSNTIRGAVASWAKTMANELGEHGITVNNVLPGATGTGRLDEIINNKAKSTGADPAAVKAVMEGQVPMKRIGRPEEIAAMVAFLCTPAAAYVNGTSIPVDGGRTGSI
ncbi:MAG: 3-oxoacyl-[acyl-carrier protein] reductase [Sphingobacteriales bacterium]|jgi:3-oxoacyl-[acyl-carrier protein] reductase